MSEKEIELAAEYMRRIMPKFASSVLKILYAYAAKSENA